MALPYWSNDTQPRQSILCNQIFATVVVFESLKVVYFSTVHSIISYGIIFWGISTHSKIIIKIQKWIIRIIMKSDNKISCWDLFKKLYILPLQFQYIFSLLMSIVKNKDFFKTNLDVHSFNTRSDHDLIFP